MTFVEVEPLAEYVVRTFTLERVRRVLSSSPQFKSMSCYDDICSCPYHMLLLDTFHFLLCVTFPVKFLEVRI